MKKVRLTTILVLAILSLSVISCKDAKTDKNDSTEHHSEMNADGDHSKMNHDNSDGHHDGEKKEMAMNGNGASQAVLNDYFNLKDALVADDNAKAKNLGTAGRLQVGNKILAVLFLFKAGENHLCSLQKRRGVIVLGWKQCQYY